MTFLNYITLTDLLILGLLNWGRAGQAVSKPEYNIIQTGTAIGLTFKIYILAVLELNQKQRKEEKEKRTGLCRANLIRQHSKSKWKTYLLVNKCRIK